jgi:RimJ/RimL family protein N-acetyltransferase
MVDLRLRTDVDIRPWADGDLPLLERLLGDPAMMLHLGGPETREKICARHERYLGSDDRCGGLFAIVVGPGRMPVGWVGYWETSWRDDVVWESGWHVLPECQGEGVATAGTALMLERARLRGTRRSIHAFPSVENAASNALCRRLGFSLLGEVEVEYPKGSMMRSYDWSLELRARAG